MLHWDSLLLSFYLVMHVAHDLTIEFIQKLIHSVAFRRQLLPMMKPVGVSIIVFWASIIIWICSANAQDCDRFNTSRISEVESSSSFNIGYFSRTDGGLLMPEEVWYETEVGEFIWICSDGDNLCLPELLFYHNYNGVTLGVITTAETRFATKYYQGRFGSICFFGGCHIGV